MYILGLLYISLANTLRRSLVSVWASFESLGLAVSGLLVGLERDYLQDRI